MFHLPCRLLDYVSDNYIITQVRINGFEFYREAGSRPGKNLPLAPVTHGLPLLNTMHGKDENGCHAPCIRNPTALRIRTRRLTEGLCSRKNLLEKIDFPFII